MPLACMHPITFITFIDRSELGLMFAAANFSCNSYLCFVFLFAFSFLVLSISALETNHLVSSSPLAGVGDSPFSLLAFFLGSPTLKREVFIQKGYDRKSARRVWRHLNQRSTGRGNLMRLLIPCGDYLQDTPQCP